MSSVKQLEYSKAATRAGLHYVTDGLAGITRHRAGKGWSYFDAEGARISDADMRKRLNGMAIPPAWGDVWICPDPDGHIQAYRTRCTRPQAVSISSPVSGCARPDEIYSYV